jgi:primosomal protein N' (replication factor Y)
MQPDLPGSPPLLRARVMLNEPVGLLDYRVPEALAAQLKPGMAVRVPLGRRRTSAYVAALEAGPGPEGITLKDLDGLDPERPPLPDNVIRLLLFAADYYAVPPGEMLSAALPAMARPATQRFKVTEAGRAAHTGALKEAERALLEIALRFPNGFTLAAVERDLGVSRSVGASRLKKAVERGWLTRQQKRARPKQQVLWTRVADADPAVLTSRQAAARALLAHIPADDAVPMAQLLPHDARAPAHLKSLEKLGLVRRELFTPRALPYVAPTRLTVPPEPTAEQAEVLGILTAAMDAGGFHAYLLHGVTGSGKTEVYLRAIAHALERGRTALVLVPEIALTPQLGERFRGRFGDRVATFHSGLTGAERRDEWERVAQGEVQIGLGARSALFLPLTRLGVIIVDEEHETSFKQEESPRYHARDLAVWRARQDDAIVVLGSATPSLETHANADAGRYTRLAMPHRVSGRALPAVECIPLAEAPRVGDGGVFTEKLAQALERTLGQDEQAILFLNRRGFAPYVYCRDCGHSYRCDDCDVSLTLHRRRGVLMCHYCGFETEAPDTCGSCQGHRVGASGVGTERLEADIRTLFGPVPLVRLDRDTVRKKNDLEEALGRFRRREAKLLIGTQMVAKGHDFPGVTLVGVISADASLNFPDFRASERTFQLLTQVAGRAGRGDKPGHVLIQAYEAEHPAIRTAMTHDYETFVTEELVHRRELDYPPFTHLALLRFEGMQEASTTAAANEHAEALRHAVVAGGWPVSVLGPAAAPLARLRGLWRQHVLLKGKTRKGLRQALQHLPRRPGGDVRRILDVDPMSML